MTTIFHITGGLGKHIAASGVINSYKDKNPDSSIIVSSAYPAIFEKNPSVEESLLVGQHKYFYKNYIHNKDVVIYAHEPYHETDHILKKQHLITTWCNLVGVDNTVDPSLHLTFRDYEIARKILFQYLNKPILIFQPFGGPPSKQPYCWARDIHPELAQKIVDVYKEEYNVIHICNPNHPQLHDAIRIDEKFDPNVLAALLHFSKKRILIDSSLQHAANALYLPSTVLWNVTSPEIFGYKLHTNIVSNIDPYREGASSSYLFDYDISGNVGECPFEEHSDIYDNDIINQIKNSTN